MLTNTKFPGHLKSPTENSRRDPAISPRDTEVRPLSAPNCFTMSYEAENTDIVRKWGLKFDESENPIEFLERVTELTRCFHISPYHVLRKTYDMVEN